MISLINGGIASHFFYFLYILWYSSYRVFNPCFNQHLSMGIAFLRIVWGLNKQTFPWKKIIFFDFVYLAISIGNRELILVIVGKPSFSDQFKQVAMLYKKICVRPYHGFSLIARFWVSLQIQ